jgi:chlorobactene glucosyltransferase
MIWLFLSTLWLVLAMLVSLLMRSRYAAMGSLNPRTRPPETMPSLAVIVPARDEAESIGACLSGLIAQTYPAGRMQVVVVDDGSTDGTASIARQFEQGSAQLTVIDAGPLPPGWIGKSHACWVGAKEVDADWLCFIDADTRHEPSLLVSAMSTALQGNTDLLSLHPRQEMLGFWERMLMPISFMSLMILLDARRINNPNSKNAMANGQFILIQQKVYEDVGGHHAIMGQILEDVALARLVKSRGYRLRLMGGDQLIRTRMYTNLKALWQGLARGGAELFGVPLTSLAILNSMLFSFLPLVYPLWQVSLAIGMPETNSWISAVVACLGSITWYSTHAIAMKTYRVPARYLLLLPVAYLLIALVNTEGILGRLRGRRLWKGRRI